MDGELRHSMAAQPQQEREQAVETAEDIQTYDKLNQHVLLTVQAVNQMQAVFTVRGA